MSDRTDRKMVMVPVGSYAYRHEAEFAAGFLEDARIPYRLQIDDPVLGLSLSEPAVLYVLGADERRARAVLEATSESAVSDLDEGTDDDVDDERPPSRPRPTPHSQPTRMAPARTGRADEVTRTSLPLRQRLVAITGGGAALLAGLGLGAGSPGGIGLIGLSAVLGVAGLLGRAPDFLARLLSAVAGDAP